MRVRRLTNWYGPRGMICVGDVHEIDDEVGRQQLACDDVELAPAAKLTPASMPDIHVDVDTAHAVTSTEAGTGASAASDTDDAQSEDVPSPAESIAAMTAQAAIAAIAKLESLDDLVEVHDAEMKGKARTTVLAAIEAREAELSAASDTDDAQSEDAAS